MSFNISICMPSVHGKYIKESLDSIFSEKNDNFEVIVNDSSTNFYVSDLLSEYDLKIIKKETKSFESRYLTVNESRGNNVLLFDETRIMKTGLLERLSSMQNDMVVIGERDIGKGFLTLISNLDKNILSSGTKSLSPLKNKSIIPRFYNRNIVIKALKEISSNLPDYIIREIIGLDLELIYLEAYKISQNIGIIPTPEILHYGDENFRAVFKKYYRYGKSQKMLRNGYYGDFAGLSGRNRTTALPREWIMGLPLQIVRGIPFLLGYISNKSKIIPVN
ncbi:MAG: hypothetical protein ACYDAO_08210 [Thermoplasmataceae archaeon]